jgi:uncharacterized membrane protein
VTVPAKRDGAVMGCSIRGIVELARRADRVVELVPQVGDYIARGDPLFRIYGGGGEGGSSISPEVLRRRVEIGPERSLEQDPTFAFRIIVDIGSKALSAAINDPTTAVLAIDQLQHLLRLVSGRDLDAERVRDRFGVVRLIYRTPGWEDFIHLAATEVRQYGCESIQVNRRLRAMLESLLRAVPDVRKPALRQELEMLSRSVARFFPGQEEQAIAAQGDYQGVGGRKASEMDGDGATVTPDGTGAPAGGV